MHDTTTKDDNNSTILDNGTIMAHNPTKHNLKTNITTVSPVSRIIVPSISPLSETLQNNTENIDNFLLLSHSYDKRNANANGNEDNHHHHKHGLN